MSSMQCPPLPQDTARAAESAFGSEHPYIKMGESLNHVWDELNLSAQTFQDLFLTNYFYPHSLMTILQYWEYMTDRQMSQAARTRLDMKYAMHLPLNFPGIEPAALCGFRQRVLAEWKALEAMQWLIHSLNSLVDRGEAVGANRVISAVCLPSRAEHTLEHMSMALEAIASADPYWLKIHTLPHWFRRYHLTFDQHKFPLDPKEIKSMIQSVGNDGLHLLAEIEKSEAVHLSRLPEVASLSEEWREQFIQEDNVLKFREPHCLSCSYEINIIQNISRRKEENDRKEVKRG